METLLINKYKPQSFEEMNLDSYLIDFLNTLIETSNLNLLITGENESGKTLLSHILLQQYYKNESIIEINKNILIINTLKEQGIQYFKNDLKIFFQTCSTLSHKKKTIIIDNIDLINENCQMILKEYIESYPNINFILTITNYQKLIDNLQSCLLTVKITKPTIEYLDTLLNTIITKENLIIDEDSKKFILQISNYSYKVIINYCEKIKLLHLKIDMLNVLRITTNIHFYKFEELHFLLKEKKIYEAMILSLKIIDDDYSVIDFLDNYYLFVKITLLIEEEVKYEIIKLICKYIIIFYNIHEEEVEIILFIKNIYNIYDKKY